jgi:hypothetical protein
MNVLTTILSLALLPLLLTSYAQIWWGGIVKGWRWFWRKPNPSLPMRLARYFFLAAEAAVVGMIVAPDSALALPAFVITSFAHITCVLMIQDKRAAR